MKNTGTNTVYLTGSKKYIDRVIWEDASGKLFVKWYGEMIAVERGEWCFYTVDAY